MFKYLNCIDCWLSLKKTNKHKTKLFELYYRGWHCSGMGQSFLQSSSYHSTILVQELEIFLIYFLFHIRSSQHEHEAQRHQGAEHSQMIVGGTWPSEGLCRFGDDDFIELQRSLEYGFVTYADTTLCLDKIFASAPFLAHFFVFYGYILKSWTIFPRQILQLRANVIQ